MRPIQFLPLSAVLLLSGCAGNPLFQNVPVLGAIEHYLTNTGDYASREPRQENHRPTPLPEPGTSLSIVDSDTGESFSAIIDRIYMSASGRYCSYYFESGDRAQASEPAGLTCYVAGEAWMRFPYLLNPDQPRL